MWWRKPSLFAGKKKIDAINETEDKSIGNESNKGMSLVKSRSLDKSRASQRTETENTEKH